MGRMNMVVQQVFVSIVSMIWLIAIFGGILLFFSIVFMNATARAFEAKPADGDRLAELFGTLPLSAVSLFSAVTGGIEWKSTFDALYRASDMYAWAFVIYVFFMVFGLSNTVLAMFVESCLHSASQMREKGLEEARFALLKGFNHTQLSKDGEVSLTDFVGFLDNVQMREHLKAMELNLSEAKAIFHLMDIEGYGRIDVKEALYSCERFARPIRSVDFVAVLLNLQRLGQDFQTFRSNTIERFNILGSMVSTGTNMG